MAETAKIIAKGSQPISLFACIVDEVTREATSRAAAQLGWSDAVIREGGLGAAPGVIDPANPPRLLLVDLDKAAAPPPGLADLIKRCGSNACVLAIGTVNDVSLFRRLTLLGISDYLVKPVSSETLAEAFRRATSGDAPAEAPKPHTRIHAFIGTRGGVGTTTLALGTAWILLHEHKLRTALLDLDLHFGNLALTVDLEPGRGLRHALANPERADALLLSSAIVKAGDKLPILAGEEPLEEMLRFEPGAATALLNGLTDDYNCIVVDVPRSLDSVSRKFLAAADTTVIVTDLSLASLRDALRLVDLVKAIGGRAAPLFVGSQVGAVHRGEIARAEFERGLGAALDFAVPFDAKAARAMAQTAKALPVAASSSKAAAEMKQLAARLSGQEEKTTRLGLKRWFG